MAACSKTKPQRENSPFSVPSLKIEWFTLRSTSRVCFFTPFQVCIVLIISCPAGFFGVPDYTTVVYLAIGIEWPGYTNSGAPTYSCPNSNTAKGSIGSAAAAAYGAVAFNSTDARLNTWITGYNFTANDANSMIQLCAYEV